MAGQELRKLGFTSIHASDMSTQILEQAKQKVSIFIFQISFQIDFAFWFLLTYIVSNLILKH